MLSQQLPERLVILDVDGLRRDVFMEALRSGQAPHLARLTGGPDGAQGLHLEALSTAPSITFCAQTSLFTGQHPARHGVPGNQFFDRFRGRFYAFDIGDTLAVDDAVLVFTGEGLLSRVIPRELPTLYERAKARGLSSCVVYHMIARGADTWIQPELSDIARFTRGGGLLGMSAEAYDGEMMDRAVRHLRGGARPDILTVYFMGLDHQSHEHGPGVQASYLAQVIDPLVGRLSQELERLGLFEGCLFAVVSDHGQVGVIADDRHSLRIGFPFDREMGHLFDALGYDVHDLPGEDLTSDAVIASNGGMAHVYLRLASDSWAHPVPFDEVLRAAGAFWEAHHAGQNSVDLHQALSLVLVRNTQSEGWGAPYQAVTPDGSLQPLQTVLANHPLYSDSGALSRISHLAGPLAGDLLLHSNLADGYYFGNPLTGVHGGLLPGESHSVLSFGWPGGRSEDVEALNARAARAVYERCQREGGRQPGVTDLVTVLEAVFL